MGNCPPQCPSRLGRAITDNEPEKVDEILTDAGQKAPALINNDHSPDCAMDCLSPTIGNAFYNAVDKDRTEIAQIMLKHGADVYSLGFNDETCLHCAARMNNMEILRMLLDAGCDVHVTDDTGCYPIHSAAGSTYNTVNMVKYLIDHVGQKEDVNLQDYSGRTPLHDAACSGTIHVVKFLVENGADINAKTKLGNTPLYFAKTRLDISDFLVENGAEVESS